jgi:hypothetical protein
MACGENKLATPKQAPKRNATLKHNHPHLQSCGASQNTIPHTKSDKTAQNHPNKNKGITARKPINRFLFLTLKFCTLLGNP